ncbi:hypothetical protein [Streptomyces sp. NPDC002580]|uniref:hypothetical protein n=1 Tax=Streptomyces sp. NPDC002580 TaxID=3364653 RepID=UPI00369C5106
MSTPIGHRPSGLTWAVLRLHRTALVLWGAALVAAAATLTWMYVIGPDARAALGPCGSRGTGLPACADLRAIDADETYRAGIGLVATGLTYLMFPVAAWAGAALIGRELETGTARLAWTRSAGPVRWLAAKLAVPAGLLTAGTTAAVLLTVWARRDGDPALVGAWYDTDVWFSTGPVAVAYALAGLALGALAGLALRRALPAAGAALAAASALFLVLREYRLSLWPTTTVTGPAALRLPPGALDLLHSTVLGDGTRLDNNTACVGQDTATGIRNCMRSTGVTEFWAAYHPESHFWPLQLVESGVLLAVAGLATAAAFALLRHRTP